MELRDGKERVDWGEGRYQQKHLVPCFCRPRRYSVAEMKHQLNQYHSIPYRATCPSPTFRLPVAGRLGQIDSFQNKWVLPGD